MPATGAPDPGGARPAEELEVQRSLKRQLVFGLAALAVVAFAGGAYAATQSSTPNTRQAFLNDVAKRLGVTPQQLTAALNGATADQLQAAVKAGHLTQAQADALAQRLRQNAAGALPFPPIAPFLARPLLGRGLGGFGPGGPRGFRRIGPLAGAVDLPAAASYLGLTDAQLLQQLAAGKSLAQIATSKGKTVSGLEQAMTTAIKARLDKLVSNKLITAAQETRILSRFSARLSQAVNQKGMSLVRRPALRFPYPIPPGPGAPGAAPAPGARPKGSPSQAPPAYAKPPGAPPAYALPPAYAPSPTVQPAAA
jgi:hypothetical protein